MLTKMGKVLDAYAAKKGVAKTALRLVVDGNRINADDTPTSVRPGIGCDDSTIPHARLCPVCVFSELAVAALVPTCDAGASAAGFLFCLLVQVAVVQPLVFGSFERVRLCYVYVRHSWA